MGVLTFEMEVVTQIPPARMYKAFALDGENLIPKVVPQAIKNIEYIEGNREPGSIKNITFAEGKQPIHYVKHKVEGRDKEKLTYSYSVIEEDALMNALEKITYETKIIPSSDGGSICKSISNYYTIGDFKINEEQIKASKEKASEMFRAVEAYLLAIADA